MTPYILVADFGSQYTRLIVRRLREQHFQSEIVPWQQLEERLKEAPPCGIILSGGPASVCDGDAPQLPLSIYECGLPILGICYGEMLICAQLGGKVRSSHAREYGRSELTIIADSPLTASIWPAGTSGDVWMSHGDEIAELPPGFATIGQTQSAPFAIIADPARKIYGLQFHPEVVHSQSGEALLASFAANIANCPKNWHMAAFKNRAIAQIREQVGDSQVICALSGGVDSAVAALLVHEAIGSQLTCIMVDHGLLRTGEAENICQLFRQKANITLKLVNAGDRFMAALKPVTDPEEKRRIIGGLFIDVFEEEAQRIGDVQFLVQGTLYTDVIESMAPTGAASVTIKSHHNVGGLPARMKLRLIEPLRDLFKDEVRLLGREIGLAEEFINRHPFPGPGLALRCPGEITEEKLAILRHADTLFLDEIRKAGLYDEIWQAFVVLLPVRSVGVMGDGRSYERACVLRAVTASDGMTADIYRFTPDFLQRAATRIVNEVKGINRVLYDITSKPPGTIEWE